MKISKNLCSPIKSYEAGKVRGRGGSHEELLETVFKWRFGLNWTTPTLKMKNTCTFHSFPLSPLVLYAGFISSPSECPISHGQFFSKIDTAPLHLLFYSLLRTRFRSVVGRGFLCPPWDQSSWEAPYKCKSLPLWRKELETPFSKGSGCTLHFILPAWQILHSPYPGSAKDCIVSRAPSQHAQLIMQVLPSLFYFFSLPPHLQSQKAVTLWVRFLDLAIC